MAGVTPPPPAVSLLKEYSGRTSSPVGTQAAGSSERRYDFVETWTHDKFEETKGADR